MMSMIYISLSYIYFIRRNGKWKMEKSTTRFSFVLVGMVYMIRDEVKLPIKKQDNLLVMMTEVTHTVLKLSVRVCR